MIDDLETNKLVLRVYKKDELGFDECLTIIGNSDVQGEERENWRFAYDNAFNWEVVEEKFKKAKESNEVKQANILKQPSKIKFDPSIKTPTILTNGVIIIQMLTEDAYSKSIVHNLNYSKVDLINLKPILMIYS